MPVFNADLWALHSLGLPASHFVCRWPNYLSDLKERSFRTTCFSMLNIRWFSDRFFMLFIWEWIIKTRACWSWPLIILGVWNGNHCSIKIRFFIWLNYMMFVTHGVLLRSSLNAESLTRKICLSSSDLCREWYIDHR